MSNPENIHKTRVVGGKFRKDVVWSDVTAGQSARIIHDPYGRATNNKHNDPNALAVFVQQKGCWVQIGYLPREEAALLGPAIASGQVAIDGRLTWVTGENNVHLQYELSEVSVEIVQASQTSLAGSP